MITSELNRIPKGNNICFSENLSHMLSPEIRRVIVCVAQLTDWLTDTCVSKDMPAASACVCVWAQPWPPLFSFSPVLLALGIQHTSEAEKVKVTCPDAPNVLRRSSGSAPARWRWLSFFWSSRPYVYECGWKIAGWTNQARKMVEQQQSVRSSGQLIGRQLNRIGSDRTPEWPTRPPTRSGLHWPARRRGRGQGFSTDFHSHTCPLWRCRCRHFHFRRHSTEITRTHAPPEKRSFLFFVGACPCSGRNVNKPQMVRSSRYKPKCNCLCIIKPSNASCLTTSYGSLLN